LAVYKDADYWAYLRFDLSTQKLSERQLLTTISARLPVRDPLPGDRILVVRA
jgi:hypothetical protein